MKITGKRYLMAGIIGLSILSSIIIQAAYEEEDEEMRAAMAASMQSFEEEQRATYRQIQAEEGYASQEEEEEERKTVRGGGRAQAYAGEAEEAQEERKVRRDSPEYADQKQRYLERMAPNFDEITKKLLATLDMAYFPQDKKLEIVRIQHELLKNIHDQEDVNEKLRAIQSIFDAGVRIHEREYERRRNEFLLQNLPSDTFGF